MRGFGFNRLERRFAHAERHGHGHHGRHGRHGRGGRVFDHGDLRLLVLRLLADRPRHGYEIIKEIEERLGGTYSPSPGVIYPTLTLLEELGHAAIESTEGSRKLFAITEAGRQFLAGNAAAVDAVMARFEEAQAARVSVHAPQILRAMENLKTALRLRTSRGPLGRAVLDAIAAAIDAAALSIERSGERPGEPLGERRDERSGEAP